MKLKLWMIPATTLSCLAFFHSLAFSEVRWQMLAPDLEMTQSLISTTTIFNSEILAFRTSLTKFQLGVVESRAFGTLRGTAKTLALASKAPLIINANFFDEQGMPLGLVISRGIPSSSIHYGGQTLTGILSVSHLGVAISHRSDRIPSSSSEAIQSGPRLILNGKITENVNSEDRSRRSAVCLDKKQRLIILVSSGLVGVTLHELQLKLKEPDFDCQDALNLDGGGSSQLYVNTKILTDHAEDEEIFIAGRDPIPVALGLFPRSAN